MILCPCSFYRLNIQFCDLKIPPPFFFPIFKYFPGLCRTWRHFDEMVEQKIRLWSQLQAQLAAISHTVTLSNHLTLCDSSSPFRRRTLNFNVSPSTQNPCTTSLFCFFIIPISGSFLKLSWGHQFWKIQKISLSKYLSTSGALCY